MTKNYQTKAASGATTGEVVLPERVSVGQFQRSVHGPGHDDRCC